MLDMQHKIAPVIPELLRGEFQNPARLPRLSYRTEHLLTLTLETQAFFHRPFVMKGVLRGYQIKFPDPIPSFHRKYMAQDPSTSNCHLIVQLDGDKEQRYLVFLKNEVYLASFLKDHQSHV